MKKFMQRYLSVALNRIPKFFNRKNNSLVESCEVVYRAVLDEDWIYNERLGSIAFNLRKSAPPDGLPEKELSLERAKIWTISDVVKSFRLCYGVGELIVNNIREIEVVENGGLHLDVIATPIRDANQNRPAHASILNMINPLEDRKKSQRLAKKLALQSVFRPPN